MQLDLFKNEEDTKPEEGVREKRCTGCGDWFPMTEEHFYKGPTYTNKHGKTSQWYSSKCRTCEKRAKLIVRDLKVEHGHKAMGTCDCCGVAAKDTSEVILHLDHCHETQTYRGHLCSSCNRGIGMLGDDLTGVLQAVEYLKKVIKSEED